MNSLRLRIRLLTRFRSSCTEMGLLTMSSAPAFRTRRMMPQDGFQVVAMMTTNGLCPITWLRISEILAQTCS